MSKSRTQSVQSSLNKSKKQFISFAISRIELIEKKIMEDYEPKNGDNIKFRLSVDFSADYVTSFFLVKIGCSFVLDDSNTEVLKLIVHNEYHVKDLKSYIVNKKFSDKGFMEFITDLSLNHTRGIQSTIINGTLMNKLLIPFIKPDNIANETID